MLGTRSTAEKNSEEHPWKRRGKSIPSTNNLHKKEERHGVGRT